MSQAIPKPLPRNELEADLVLVSKGQYGQFNDTKTKIAVKAAIAFHLALNPNSSLIDNGVIARWLIKTVRKYRPEVFSNDVQLEQLFESLGKDPEKGLREMIGLLTHLVVYDPKTETVLVHLPQPHPSLKAHIEAALNAG